MHFSPLTLPNPSPIISYQDYYNYLLSGFPGDNLILRYSPYYRQNNLSKKHTGLRHSPPSSIYALFEPFYFDPAYLSTSFPYAYSTFCLYICIPSEPGFYQHPILLGFTFLTALCYSLCIKHFLCLEY